VNRETKFIASEAEGQFCCLNLCNAHSLGNIACFNSVCLHINWKSHTALWFKLYCQRWRTPQGHKQSCILEKWQYLTISCKWC